MNDWIGLSQGNEYEPAPGKVYRHSYYHNHSVRWAGAGAGGWSGVREKYCWLAGGWKLVLERYERKTLLS